MRLVRRETKPTRRGHLKGTFTMAIDFASASASLVSKLDRSASKFVKPTRDGIGACVRFVLETGGIQGGRRKKGDEPAIPSTRQLLMDALTESGFCSSKSSAANFADVALAIVRGRCRDRRCGRRTRSRGAYRSRGIAPRRDPRGRVRGARPGPT